MWQIITTIIFYIFLFGMLVLLFLIWRSSVTRIARMQQALIDVSNKSAETAKTAAEAAQRAIALMEKKHNA